jgi:hypothetical protein
MGAFDKDKEGDTKDSGDIDSTTAILDSEDVDGKPETKAPEPPAASAEPAAPLELPPTAPAPAEPAAAPEPPKKKRGIKSMFSKKSGNGRETDLSKLVSPDAKAPQVASLLAKLLSFGAPGRFPRVTAMPGDMPMEEFDLEKAKDMLVAACADAGVSTEEGADIFANVVNCMLVDLVDLASTSLKEEEKVTFDAINIVINFMNHAASLYDAVAEVSPEI